MFQAGAAWPTIFCWNCLAFSRRLAMLLVRRSAGPSVRASKLGDDDPDEAEDGRAAETGEEAATEKEEDLGGSEECWVDDAGDGMEDEEAVSVTAAA